MRLDDLGNDKKLDEVSLGDYRTKAAKQKALSQMGAMFGRDAEQKAKDLETYRRREAGLNRVKSRDEATRQAAQKKQMDDNIARLPELRAEYEDMKKKYKSLGGSNWQYADREQNLTDYERKARDMEGPMNNLWRTIQAAERAQREQGVNEMDSQGYRGSRYDNETSQGTEGTGRVAKPADVVKHGADILNRAMDKTRQVQDRKTGKWYDPDEEFDKLKNSPDFIGVMKRMSTREGVAEGSEQIYNILALDKGNALKKPTKLKWKASSLEDIFDALAAQDWYPLEINGIEVIAGKRLKQGVAEAEKNPHTSALGKALYRDLSKEKKASPQQVQRNKERWAKRQAEREQGVAENYPKHQDLSGVSTDKLKAYLARQSQQSVPGEGSQVKRVQAELQRRSQGVAEGERMKTASGMYRDQHTGVAYRGKTGQDGNDSYMTPDYLIQKYQERLAQIASGPYKRPKEVAQLKSRIAKLQGQQGVAEGSELTVQQHKSPYEGAEVGEYTTMFNASPNSAQRFAKHIISKGGKARIGKRGQDYYVYHNVLMSKEDWRKSEQQGVAESSSTMWEVSFDYGPHQSESVKVKAGSEEEARAKVEKAAEKKGRSIMVNWAKPAEQGVAEGSSYDDWYNGMVKRKAERDARDAAKYGAEPAKPSKTLAKLMRIPGFNKVSPAEQQRVAKAVDGYLARDISFERAVVLAQKQGVAEASRQTDDPFDDMVEDYLDYLDSIGELRKGREQEKSDLIADLEAGYVHPSEIEYALSGTKWDPLGETSVTDYNPKSQGGTRKELLAKYTETGDNDYLTRARRAGASQSELQAALNSRKGNSAIRQAMEAVDADQRRAKQVPAEEMPKKTSPVLGKKEKQHPFKGRAVGGQ
jgi:hypothetical protein